MCVKREEGQHANIEQRPNSLGVSDIYINIYECVILAIHRQMWSYTRKQ